MKRYEYIGNYMEEFLAGKVSLTDNKHLIVISLAHKNLGKASNSVSFVSTQWGEPTSLAGIEFYPIPCHNTMTATCIRQCLVRTQHQAGL